MTGELWIDLLLLALLTATTILLYRLRTAQPVLIAESAEDATSGRSLLLTSRFPEVAQQAGFDPSRLRWFYWLAKILLAIVLPLFFSELWAISAPRPPLLLLIVAGLIGFFLPDLWLWMRRRQRQRQIRRVLSYFLDLLVALLFSGLSLERAFRRAGRAGLEPSHPLAQEVRRVERELDAGAERHEAFRALADRTGIPELRALAAAMGLAVRHGTSVETALETQAEMLRTRRRENARAMIAAAATKSIFPLFLCGFPVLLVIVFFPALLEFIETLRAFTGFF